MRYKRVPERKIQLVCHISLCAPSRVSSRTSHDSYQITNVRGKRPVQLGTYHSPLDRPAAIAKLYLVIVER